MIALLPDLDSRFERLYGYLNDDVTRRRASVGLALQLAGASGLSGGGPGPAGAEPAAGQRRVWSLVEDLERPLLTRGLRVPDRVARPPARRRCPGRRAGRPDRRGRPATGPRCPTSWRTRLPAGVRLVHLKERVVGSGAATAVAALAEFGTAGASCSTWTGFAAVADPRARRRPCRPRGAAARCRPGRRTGRARGGVARRVVRWLTEAEIPVLLFGSSTWDPQWSTRKSAGRRRAGAHGGGSRRACGTRELGAPAPRRRPGSTPTGWPATWRWGRLRCGGPSTPPGPRPSCVTAGSPPTTCDAAYGPRTPPGWNGWPGGSSPRSAGTTWCWRRPYAARSTSSRLGPGIATRCSPSGGCGAAVVVGAA